LIETDGEVGFDVISIPIIDQFSPDNEISSIEELNSESQIHKLTHQHLHIKFWKVKVKGSIRNGIDYETLKTYPFPIVIFNFIENDFLN
jgi:A/G-specific adenine glycosylase